MTTGSSVVRVVIGVIGVLHDDRRRRSVRLSRHPSDCGSSSAAPFWSVAVIIETSRYRSQAAERTQVTPGPGGGEPDRPDPRFRPTDEIFVDPTSNHRMRVWVDSTTGERRYVAEG